MYDDFAWTRVSTTRNELTRAYEPIQPFMLVALARHFESLTFFDVGANIGVYSVFLGSQPEVSQVLAFEPMPELALEAQKNADLNGLSEKIQIIPRALSATEGEATFNQLDTYSGAGGLASTYPFEEAKVKHRLQVQLDTLDNYLQVATGAVCLKVDVEGHEYEALAGGTKLLGEREGLLQVEVHETSVRRNETFALLDSLGWKRVLRIGWDYYYSNSPRLYEEPQRTAAIEDGLQFVVDDSLSGSRPARRRIGFGVTVELSRQQAARLKQLLRRS